jgi:hypothetical protein
MCLLFGPLADLTTDIPNDFQPYPPSRRRKIAKGTQKSCRGSTRMTRLCWELCTAPFRVTVVRHMTVRDPDVHLPQQPRPPAIDGTGTPSLSGRPTGASHGQPAPAVHHRPQRWFTISGFNSSSLADQEATFDAPSRLHCPMCSRPRSHLSHVELRYGDTADASKAKRGEMVRRSTPYASRRNGRSVLWGFAASRRDKRMEAIYGMNGNRDASPTTPHPRRARLLRPHRGDVGSRDRLTRQAPSTLVQIAASQPGWEPDGDAGDDYVLVTAATRRACCANIDRSRPDQHCTEFRRRESPVRRRCQ